MKPVEKRRLLALSKRLKKEAEATIDRAAKQQGEFRSYNEGNAHGLERAAISLEWLIRKLCE